MPFRLNGVECDDVRLNGVECENAYLNGSKVFTAFGTHIITPAPNSSDTRYGYWVDLHGSISTRAIDDREIKHIVIHRGSTLSSNYYLVVDLTFRTPYTGMVITLQSGAQYVTVFGSSPDYTSGEIINLMRAGTPFPVELELY